MDSADDISKTKNTISNSNHRNQGSCMEMCPEQERKMRELQMRLHPLEMLQGTENSRRPVADPSATIKEYSRSAAGKASALNSDLRPPQVLLKTMHYIFNRILPRADFQYVELYDFAFDRLRCVRQDLVIQRAVGAKSAQILELAVRFHLYSGYRLCTEPLSQFDSKINDTHTLECLKRLLVLYQDADIEGAILSTNREEFEALYLLFNLGSQEALHHVISLPRKLRRHPSIHLALCITSAHLQRNFVRVWRLASQCDFIQSCALHRHLKESRRQALCMLNTAFSSKNLHFPIGVVSKWMLFNTDLEVAEFCQSMGLKVEEKGVQFQKSAVIGTDAKHLPSTKCGKLVDCKQGQAKLQDIILGHQKHSHVCSKAESNS